MCSKIMFVVEEKQLQKQRLLGKRNQYSKQHSGLEDWFPHPKHINSVSQKRYKERVRSNTVTGAL